MFKADKAFNSYKFLSWLDDFIQSRQGKSNLLQIQLPHLIDSLNQFPENGDQDFEKSEENDCRKKPMDNRKRKLHGSSRSSLLQEMKFSICPDIRDMVKLRNVKSGSVLQEESEEELFS